MLHALVEKYKNRYNVCDALAKDMAWAEITADNIKISTEIKIDFCNKILKKLKEE